MRTSVCNKVTPSKRRVYGYSRFMVIPIKTKTGKVTRRNYKRKTGSLKEFIPFRLSSSDHPIKYLSYKTSYENSHKVTKRQRLGKKTYKSNLKKKKFR